MADELLTLEIIMSNESLIEKAKEAITAVFSDQSVSQAKTREALEDIIGDINIMLDTIE